MSEAPTTTAPPAQTILRILALVFGLAGGLSAAYCGYAWKAKIDDAQYQKDLKEATDTNLLSAYDEASGTTQKFASKAKDLIEEHEYHTLGWPILMACLPIGIIAGVLAFLRIVPLVAAALMIAAFASPAAFGFDVQAFLGCLSTLIPGSTSDASVTPSIGTCPLAVGALLASLIQTKSGAKAKAASAKQRVQA